MCAHQTAEAQIHEAKTDVAEGDTQIKIILGTSHASKFVAAGQKCGSSGDTVHVISI